MVDASTPGPPARTFVTRRQVHLITMTALLLGHTLAHYLLLLPLPHALEEITEKVPYFNYHVLHEAEYLAIIAYAALVFRLIGGIIALVATLIASLPFIFAQSVAPLEAVEYGFSGPGNNTMEVAILLGVGGWIVAVNELWGRERDCRLRAFQELEETRRQLQFAGEMFEAAVQRLETANRQLRTHTEKATSLNELVEKMDADVRQMPPGDARDRLEAFLHRVREEIRLS